MNNNYTEREDWIKYWSSYIPESYSSFFMEKYLPTLPRETTFIEIGGFPGKIAAYFKIKYNFDVTILDYFIDPKVVNKTEIKNGIPENSINVIESNFFEYNSRVKYDIVCSFGFIEHFENIEDTIKRHVQLLKPSGILLISLPNFRGINGLLQKFADPNNLAIHNLNAMRTNILKEGCFKAGLKKVEVGYFGKFGLWLEKSAPCNNTTKHFIKFMNKYLSYFFKILNVESRLFSPFIIIRATY